MSLQQRTEAFKSQFPNIKLSKSTLFNIYKQFGIKYKPILRIYKMNEKQKQNLVEQRQEAFKTLINLINQNKKIIYIDESIFQPFSLNFKAWSNKKKYIKLKQMGIQFKTQALILCISYQQGIEEYFIQEKSINVQAFIKALQQLRLNNPEQEVIIFMDNLRIHKSKIVKELIQSWGWEIIYNAPYSSQYHCIEEVFARIKRHYRLQLQKQNFQISNKDNWNLIIESIYQVSTPLIRKVIERHLQIMKQYIGQNNMSSQ